MTNVRHYIVSPTFGICIYGATGDRLSMFFVVLSVAYLYKLAFLKLECLRDIKARHTFLKAFTTWQHVSLCRLWASITFE